MTIRPILSDILIVSILSRFRCFVFLLCGRAAELLVRWHGSRAAALWMHCKGPTVGRRVCGKKMGVEERGSQKRDALTEKWTLNFEARKKRNHNGVPLTRSERFYHLPLFFFPPSFRSVVLCLTLFLSLLSPFRLGDTTFYPLTLSLFFIECASLVFRIFFFFIWPFFLLLLTNTRSAFFLVCFCIRKPHHTPPIYTYGGTNR